jgi:hypothetical protein
MHTQHIVLHFNIMHLRSLRRASWASSCVPDAPIRDRRYHAPAILLTLQRQWYNAAIANADSYGMIYIDRITCIDHITRITWSYHMYLSYHMHRSHDILDFVTVWHPPGIENSLYSVFRTPPCFDTGWHGRHGLHIRCQSDSTDFATHVASPRATAPHHSQYLLYSTLVLAPLYLSIGM